MSVISEINKKIEDVKNKPKNKKPSNKGNMQKIYIKLLVGFFVLMFFLTIMSRVADSITIAKVEIDKLSRGLLNHNLEAEGVIEAGDDIIINADENYKIDEIYVKVGQIVKIGDPLFLLNSDDINETLLKVQADLATLQSNLFSLSNTNDTNKIDFDIEKAIKSLQRIGEDNEISKQEMDLKLSRINDDLKLAKDEITKSLEEYDETKYNENKDQLEKAQENFDNAIKKLEEVKANRDLALKRAERNINDAINALSDSLNPSNGIQNNVYRANQDYDDAVQEWKKSIKEAEEAITKAETQLSDIKAGNIDNSKIDVAIKSVGDAKKSALTMQRGLEDITNEQKKQMLQANRAVEDVMLSIEEKRKEKEREEKTQETNKIKNEYEKKSLDINIMLKNREIEKLNNLIISGGTIYSELDGEIKEIFVEKGNKVANKKLIKINQDTSEYTLVVKVDAKTAKYVNQGDAVEVMIDGRVKPIKDIFVESIKILTGEESGKLEIRVKLPEDDKIRPGLVAKMKHSYKTDEYEKCIPFDAIRSDNDSKYVLIMRETETVMGKETILARINITVLDSDNVRAAVDGGLNREDQIITKSNKNVSVGDRVRLKEQ